VPTLPSSDYRLVPLEGERLIIIPVLSLTDDRDEFLDHLLSEGLLVEKVE